MRRIHAAGGSNDAGRFETSTDQIATLCWPFPPIDGALDASLPIADLVGRAQLREKNRLAQRRARERAKAKAASAEQRISDLTTEVAAAKISAVAKREHLDATRRRLEALKAKAHAEADRLQTELLQAIRGEQAASSRAPTQQRAARSCAIFRKRRAEGVALPHAVTAAVPLLGGGEEPLLRRLTGFQAREAGRLGCDASDVAWLYECTFRPAVTRDVPIPSNLHPSGSKAHVPLLWMTARVECAMLLAMWTRLDSAAASLPLQRPLASLSPFHASSQATAAPPAEAAPPPLPAHVERSASSRTALQSLHSRTASDSSATVALLSDSSLDRAPPACGRRDSAAAAAVTLLQSDAESDETADPIEELSDRVFAFLLDDSGAAAATLRTAGRGERPPPAHTTATERLERWNRPGAQARFEGLVRHVLGGVFAEYLPLMHPADVVSLSRRLVSAFRANRPGGGEADPDAPLTSGSGVAALLTEVVALARQAARGACVEPRVPALPATLEAAARYKEALEVRMGAVYNDWTLLYIIVMLGSPGWAYRAASGFNPAFAGVAQVEQRNLRAYELLELSLEQKRAIASTRQWYRGRQAQLAEAAAALAGQLDALPSAEDLGHDLGAPASPAADPPTGKRPTPAAAPTGGGAPALATDGAPASAPEKAKPPPIGRTRSALSIVSGEPPAFGEPPRLPPPPAPLSWAQRLLGACPDETEAAGEVLEGIQRVHVARHELYVEHLCAFKEVLTPRQQASWFTAQLPFVADSWRVAAMAAADVGRDRVYGAPRLCGPLR